MNIRTATLQDIDQIAAVENKRRIGRKAGTLCRSFLADV